MPGKHKIFDPALAVCAHAFGRVVALRRWLYKKEFLKSYRLKSPVISVGNLTVGGTGKTPFVDLLLTQMERHSLRVCVLTRGYGRQSDQTLIVREDNRTKEVGEEPKWLASRHIGSLVLVSKDRARAALTLKERPDIFILDDGLQHLRVWRDYEITLLDATRPLWHYQLLPFGRAREPLASLNRSDLIVLTRANMASESQLQGLTRAVSQVSSAQVVRASLKIKGVGSLKLGGLPLGPLSQQKVLLVSGVGNPESVKSLLVLECPQLNIIKHLQYPDHYIYTSSDIEKWRRVVEQQDCDFVLTTEKDAVKLAELSSSEVGAINIGVVETELCFEPPLPDIYDLVCRKIH